MKPLAPMGTLTVLSKTTSTNPVIQQISVTEGDPGTPVLLNGDGFGDTAGEVHFIVANGKDLKATTAYWSNGQIMTEVPYLDGVNAYDGIVYVQHFDGRKSSFSSFRFKPPLDVVVLGTPDCTVKAKDIWGLNYCAQYKDSLVSSQAADNVWIAAIEHLSEIASFNADDLFWMTNTLKNGWIVSSCGVLVADRTFRGTATVTECRAGTNSPFTKVHWWIDSASGSSSIITYAPRVTITGPKGLPYF
jgi:hypothetical protein